MASTLVQHVCEVPLNVQDWPARSSTRLASTLVQHVCEVPWPARSASTLVQHVCEVPWPARSSTGARLKETPDPAQQNQRSRINAGSSNAGSSTPDPKHNARNPSRSAESTGARLKETPDPAQQNQRGIARPTSPLSLSACIGPARIGISRPLSLGLRPLRRTTEDHEFIGSDIDQSTQLVINYKHHRIGSSLPSPNISRAAPRSYAHQSHVYTSSGWSRRSRR